MLTFPTGLLNPSSVTKRLVGASVTGGQSVSGQPQYGQTTGGGLWMIEFGDCALWTKAKFNTFEAIAAMADNGATAFIVPIGDRLHQPFTDADLATPVTDGDDSTFSDGTSWSTGSIGAVLTTTAALRSTEIVFSLTGSFVNPIGGEHFTIVHPTKGTRMYRIGKINSITVTGGVTYVDAQIRPPLREAAAASTVLDFENPRVTAQVVGDIYATLSLLRDGRGKVSFLETFRPTSE